MSSVKPPNEVLGVGSEWEAHNSRTGEKIDNATAADMNPEDVDWQTIDTKDNRYITWDAKHEEWLQCDDTDDKHETKVYDPDKETWHNDGEEVPEPGSGEPPANNPGTGPAVTTPEGIFQPGSTTHTQGWVAFVDGNPISNEEASKRDPKTVTWMDAGDSKHTIKYDPDKKVWVQTNGTDPDKYYDPRHKTDPVTYKNNGGNPDSGGWNDLAYYEKYQKPPTT